MKPILTTLEKVTCYDIAWPDKNRRKLQMTEAMQAFPEVSAIGDGTEQPIQRPKDKKKQTVASGVRKRHLSPQTLPCAPPGLPP